MRLALRFLPAPLLLLAWCQPVTVCARLENISLTAASSGRFVMDNEAFERAATEKANALRESGRLLSFEKLHAQQPSREKFVFQPPVSATVPPADLYDRLRKGMVAVGSLYHDEEKAEWVLSLSSGFVVAQGGVVSTCSHVMELSMEQEGDSFAVAVDTGGNVYPVLELLADDAESDSCLIRVAAPELPPLALRPGARTGERAYCLSHPDGHYFMFTEGMVARVSEAAVNYDEVDGLPVDKSRPTLSLEVTTEFSPGSSGGLIADEAGNVIAQVASITTEQGAGVVSARSCTAAEEILRLADPALRPRPDPLKLPPASLTEAFGRLEKTLEDLSGEDDVTKADRLWREFARHVRQAEALANAPAERNRLALLRADGLAAHGVDAGDEKNAAEAHLVLTLLTDVLSTKEASPEEKLRASHQRLMLKAGLAETAADFEEWEKLYRSHLKERGEEEAAELKSTLLDLAQNLAPQRLEQLARTLLKDPDEEVAGHAQESLDMARTLREFKETPLKLSFTAVDGRKVDLAGMRGKVVLVDFWATWCGPCMEGMPHVTAAYNKLHGKGFEIIGISLDQDRDALLKTVTKKKMGWPQHFDGKGWETPLAKRHHISAIPAMWLVNKAGVVVDLDASAENLEVRVEKLLKE